MSFKQEIETWVKAVGQYDNHEFEEALHTFEEISDTAKILFNCGVIHATLGQHQKAIECYQRAIQRDQFLAIAFFQQGVSNFLIGDFEEALANFNDTLLMLRGNRFINYEQLGLTYKLYSCTVLFNRGLCYIYMLSKQVGMQDLKYAAAEKATEEHDVIDEAIAEDAEGYTVFSIGVGTLYRPSSAKVKNLKTKDYLGRARLISATEQANAYTLNADPKKAAAAAAEEARDDRPADAISFAASNLVRPGLHSRSRQQSEPPVNRNMFPPTPPPESENVRPSLPTISTSPPKAGPPHLRPEPLTLRKSSFTALEKPLPPTKPRIGTTRTASEPRGPSHRSSRLSRESQQNAAGNGGRLFMETIPARPHSGGDADIDEYPNELLEMDPSLRKKFSQSSTSSSDSHQQRHQRRREYHPSIAEEDEEFAYSSEGSSPSMDGFEMLNNAGGGLSVPPPPGTTPAPRARSRSRAHSSDRRGTSRARSSQRPHHHHHQQPQHHHHPPAPPVELKQLRVKVHYGDDTRYMMLQPDVVVYDAFLERVREKFMLRSPFKLRTKDEGDLITMGDSDDWDMAVNASKREMQAEARRMDEGRGGAVGGGAEQGMGKMEVWVTDVF